ncbi:MAG TPA: cytochrome c family protein [Caulobacteraceae bacterium]|nr:cytochrome c family protein [Caulobacteraceae bacterium]
MTRAAALSLTVFAAVLAGCGPQGGSDTTASPGAAAPAAPAPSDAEAQALLASLPAPYNGADLANGKRQFAKCRSCHTLPEGGPNMTGPNLYGVFGRQAGSKPDYRYSEALKTAGFAWDAQKLDGWLADPRGFLPGNKMSFVGVKEAKDRVDLIAYLKTQTGYKPG